MNSVMTIAQRLVGEIHHSEKRASILRSFFEPNSMLWQILNENGIKPRPHENSEEIIESVKTVVDNKLRSTKKFFKN